jgi:hypothetical protein
MVIIMTTRVFLDTSYLFPVAGIDIVEGWSRSDLLSLEKDPNYTLFYCDLSLFEIYTKSLKLILQQNAKENTLENVKEKAKENTVENVKEKAKESSKKNAITPSQKETSQLTTVDIERGINAILNCSKSPEKSFESQLKQFSPAKQEHSNIRGFFKLNWTDFIVESEIMLELKKIHGDSIDCILFSMAIMYCNCLATFDTTFIKKIRANSEICSWVQTTNPNFEVWYGDLKNNPERLL